MKAMVLCVAAGSYFFGRYVDERPRPLVKLYAGLEAGIGLFAIVQGSTFPDLREACAASLIDMDTPGGSRPAQYRPSPYGNQVGCSPYGRY